jgi:predicted dehydrogenase
MPMQRSIRWGVLGAARIALKHVLPSFGSASRSQLAGIAARDPARALAVAAQFGIPRAYGSYEELLADAAIDAVYIPLPNDLHSMWTLRALAAGKHVLCEKPIAMSAEQAQEIAAAATRYGRHVAEAYMIRFHPQWRRARARLAAGDLGEARAVYAWFSYDNPPGDNLRNSPAHGGGALYDVGGYSLVAAQWLFGGRPERVVGLFGRDAAGEVDRLTSGIADFGGGRQLVFTVSTALPRMQSVVLYGTRGRLTIETPFNPAADLPTRLLLDDGRDLYGAGLEVEVVPAADQYALQLDAFSEAIAADRPPPFGIDDAICNMRALDALFRSERSGAWEQP